MVDQSIQVTGRSDAIDSTSPAAALHKAGITHAVCQWIRSPTDGTQREIDKFTFSKQLCVWQVVEGLARHVPAAAELLVHQGVAEAVKAELTEALKEGRTRLPWKRRKTALVAQFVMTAEALSRHSAQARVTLFSLPSVHGLVLGEEYPNYSDGDAVVVLKAMLSMLTLDERCDAVLITACLHLMGSIVMTANGLMLRALSVILHGVHPILKLALPLPDGRLDLVLSRAEEWALLDKKQQGLDMTAEELSTLEAIEHGDRSGILAQPADVATVNNDSVRAMLRSLVRMMTAYAQRAEQLEDAKVQHRLGQGPVPDETMEIAVHVTNAFDDAGRDKIIFAMLANSDDDLRIQAMECLATVPTENLQREEIMEIVGFVHNIIKSCLVYVGQNELMMMHAFNCFARLCKEPDHAGNIFRRENGDIVQLALDTLLDNSEREIPESANAEREQKAQLSMALTNFLQACSGPERGRENDPDAPPVWPQAVSILRMQDSTQTMVEVMRNEESYGDTNNKLNLEQSALADTVDQLLFTLAKVGPTSDIKPTLLNRLATLLEGELGLEDGSGGGMGGGLDADDNTSETAASRKRRIQQHVSFLRRNGIDLVLTQLENELSEMRAAQRSDDDGKPSDGQDDDDNADAGVLPADATPEAVQAKVDGVLSFVQVSAPRHMPSAPHSNASHTTNRFPAPASRLPAHLPARLPHLPLPVHPRPCLLQN